MALRFQSKIQNTMLDSSENALPAVKHGGGRVRICVCFDAVSANALCKVSGMIED